MLDLSEQIRSKIAAYSIPVVESHNPVKDPHAFVEFVRELKDAEGFVIAWDNGYRVKIKAEEYVRFHKTKDNLTLEKNVIDLIVNEKLDDTKAFMLEDDRRRIDEFERQFWEGIASAVERYDAYYQLVVTHGLDRKRYAQEWMPAIKANDPFAPQYVFGRFDGKEGRQMILDYIRKNCGTQTKVDVVRSMWGGTRWSYHFEGDN